MSANTPLRASRIVVLGACLATSGASADPCEPGPAWTVGEAIPGVSGFVQAAIAFDPVGAGAARAGNVLLTLPPSPCAGDVSGDGSTDVFDSSDLAANIGARPGATRARGDPTGDGFVDVFDFSELAGDFGCGGS